MTATFNYQGKQITLRFDPVSSHVLVSTEESVIKYIDVADKAMFDINDFKVIVEQMIKDLEIEPVYS